MNDQELARKTIEQINATRNAYCKRHNLLPLRRRSICAHDLLGIRCPASAALLRSCQARREGFFDHVEFFRHAETDALMMLSQPYVQPRSYGRVTMAVAAWAKQFGLYWRISNEESWWVRGHTLLIEFWGKQPNDVMEAKNK